ADASGTLAGGCARAVSSRSSVRRRGSRAPNSDPVAPAEHGELRDRRSDDQPDGYADRPVEVVERVQEILAVEADDEGREQERGRDHRKLLDDLVLVLRDERLVVVARAGEQIARHVELLSRAKERLVRVGDEALHLLGKAL